MKRELRGPWVTLRRGKGICVEMESLRFAVRESALPLLTPGSRKCSGFPNPEASAGRSATPSPARCFVRACRAGGGKKDQIYHLGVPIARVIEYSYSVGTRASPQRLSSYSRVRV